MAHGSVVGSARGNPEPDALGLVRRERGYVETSRHRVATGSRGLIDFGDDLRIDEASVGLAGHDALLRAVNAGGGRRRNVDERAVQVAAHIEASRRVLAARVTRRRALRSEHVALE